MIYLMIIVFILSVSVISFVFYSIIYKLVECNIAYIKSKKKVSKKVVKKMLTSSKFDVEIINKLTKNMPRLDENFCVEKCKDFMQKFGLNFDLATYLISVTNTCALQDPRRPQVG